MLYRFYGSGAGTSITSITLDGRIDDKILRVNWAMGLSTPTDNEEFYAELSWISTMQRGVNDANSILATMEGRVELTTSGLAIGSLFNVFDFFDMPQTWEGGERLYLHMYTTSTTQQANYVQVITAGSGTLRRAEKRR